MTDTEIIELYWQRDELAITESERKYGAYCQSIARRILADDEDAKECVNDTWLQVWNVIPPQRPSLLSAFFAKITRNLSLNRYKANTAQKRTNGRVAIALDELDECIASSYSIENEFFKNELSGSVSTFLRTVSERDCNIFIRRYFYLQSVEEIAAFYKIKESNVFMNLSRTRKKLRNHLRKEGYLE